MADDLVTAVYIGGDALLSPLDGEWTLPGDRREVVADLVDREGSPWASRIPRGEAARLSLLADNLRAGARGDDLAPDPLDQGDTTIVELPADPTPEA